MSAFSTQRLVREIGMPFLAGVVLAILAPFGTDHFPILGRFVYWISLTFAGGLGAVFALKLLSFISPNSSKAIRSLAQSFGATLAVSPLVFALQGFGSPYAVILTLFYIWVISIVISSIGEFTSRGANTQAQDVATIQRPALLERLPPKFRDAALYAISSEDHYVRIHSAAGEHMLLMRLTDAEDLAAPLAGLKPHRSWWVAEAGVESVTKSGGKTRIALKSGTIVPVSREGAKRVKDAGWV